MNIFKPFTGETSARDVLLYLARNPDFVHEPNADHNTWEQVDDLLTALNRHRQIAMHE
jgi:hypothetical protein